MSDLSRPGVRWALPSMLRAVGVTRVAATPRAWTTGRRVRVLDPADMPALETVLGRVSERDGPWQSVTGSEGLFGSVGGRVAGRWVGTWAGLPVGFVRVGAPSHYLHPVLEVAGLDPMLCAEVGRLFVDPQVRGTGLADALLAVAVQAVMSEGLVPVLAVVVPNRSAERLYERAGWVRVGGFCGVDGDNDVWAFARK